MAYTYNPLSEGWYDDAGNPVTNYDPASGGLFYTTLGFERKPYSSIPYKSGSTVPYTFNGVTYNIPISGGGNIIPIGNNKAVGYSGLREIYGQDGVVGYEGTPEFKTYDDYAALLRAADDGGGWFDNFMFDIAPVAQAAILATMGNAAFGALGGAESGMLSGADTAALGADQVGALSGGGESMFGIEDLYNNFVDLGFSADEAAQLAQNAAGAIEGGFNIQGATGGMLDTAGNIIGASGSGISTQKGITDALVSIGMDPLQASNTAGTITNLSLTDATKANSLLKALGVGSNLLGSALSGKAATGAAQTSADAQVRAAQIAADAAKFRPVGVTTRFGSSTFGFDPVTGYLNSAGYTLSPEMKALQDQALAAAPGMMSQFTGSQAATAPMGTAAQRAMALGNQYLATDPQAQAAKYMADQQGLLAGSREQALATLQNKLAQQGRLGLATGATSTGMMATNPEMAAYQNAIQQQNLQLAANATQGGMDYAKFGAGMVGTGGDLLKGMYGTQTAAYAPFQTALSGAQTIEGLGQNALQAGIDLGSATTAANAKAGGLLAQGMMNAAATMQPANAYSPWGALLSGAGNAISQQTYDPGKFRLVPLG